MLNARINFLHLLLLASAAILSSACVSTNQHNQSILAADSIMPVPLLPVSSFDSLAMANSGDLVQLVESPWGSPIQVRVKDRYVSASNRLCLALQVAPDQLNQSALVCQNEARQWYQGRALAF
ncbi:DVU3141 family protein [Alkalimonas sp.]|uniref:DVU3141 family protein n=1 Tax=Alkalimonas sp. TaxID=1872453 RepID=UPI00263B0049|nr:DVU3141 family protein [Alkalimonas sp.]MCC5824587.1 hypothetical protein [Alkalimonas sp.]